MDKHEWKDTSPAYKGWNFSVVAMHEDGKVYPELHVSCDGVEFSHRDIDALKPRVLVREIFRLAERCEKLEGIMSLFEKGPDALEKAVAARIRKEMLEELEPLGMAQAVPWDEFCVALNRICPEEEP